MKTMRKLLQRLICSFSLIVVANAAEMELDAIDDAPEGWATNYPAALARAKAENKLVLLNFTGSDWCVWCHRLRREVFVQRPFLNYANEHLVLVQVDFPKERSQGADVKRQNAELASRFEVVGYPTVVIVDQEGRELGRSGYMQGGAKTFVRELKRYTAKARG